MEEEDQDDGDRSDPVEGRDAAHCRLRITAELTLGTLGRRLFDGHPTMVGEPLVRRALTKSTA